MARTYAELKKAKKSRTIKVPLVLDVNKAAVLKAADEDLKVAAAALERAVRRSGEDDPGVKILAARHEECEAAVKKAEAAVEGVTEWFEFAAIGSKVYTAIVKANRPSEAEIKAFHDELAAQGKPPQPMGLSPNTYPPEIMKAATVSHKHYSLEDWKSLYEDEEFSEGEVKLLWQTAHTIQEAVG